MLVLAGGCGGADGRSEPPPSTPAEAQRTPTPRTRPLATVDDILLISVDTLRADALGFADNPRAATPLLDRLAAEGVIFERAHAHNVVTLPSHVNMLTGQLPFRHGIRDNSGFVLSESMPTAATLLGAAGFNTAAVVGAFPLDGRFGLDRGFDLYDDEVPESVLASDIVPPERRGDVVVERAVRWWREHEGHRRFLFVHLYDPHAPYEPPEPFASRFPNDPYLGEVAATDAFLTPLLEPILAEPEPSVLILFTSDHGEGLGDHGELTHGLFGYEPTLRVPLVLWAASLEPERSTEPVSHIDLLPTMLQAAGLPLPEELPGRPLVGPQGAVAPQPTYFEALTPNLNRGWAPLRGVIQGGLKFIDLPLPELYDLGADPGEKHNLVREQPERAAELRALLPSDSIWPPERGQVDPEEEAALRALGYLGGGAPPKAVYAEADDPKNLLDLDRQMHEAVDLYQRRRLGEATAVLSSVVEARPDMGIAYYYWAQALLEDGQLKAAIAVMSQAYSRGVATRAVQRQLGLSLAESGRAAEAVELLRPLAESGDPDALNAYGLVLSEAGRQAEAEATLRQVFLRDERNAVTHETLALVALRRQDWAQARDEARLALDLNDNLGLAWNYLGTALYNLRQPREAVGAWKRAVTVAPDSFDALYNMAVVAREIGDLETARWALERFIGSAPPERYGADIEKAKTWLGQLPG